MECEPCKIAALARAKAEKKTLQMATNKRKASGTKTPTKRRRRRKNYGSMTGKLANRSIQVKPMDLIALVGGAALNYFVVNPGLNKLSEKMVKDDGSPLLGEHQGKIITAGKGLTAAMLAYYVKKMPKEARLALVGVSASSVVELSAQLLPDKFVALKGTGDLWSNVGQQTPMIDIPMNETVAALDSPSGYQDLPDDIALYGMDETAIYGNFSGSGDLFSGFD